MKILFVLFTSLLICSMIGCGGDEDPTSEGGGSPSGTNWHDLEQSERNERILQVALDDYGDNVKKSCKVWIYDVVYSASNGEVTLPFNNERGDGWVTDPDGYTLGGGDVILSHQNMNPALLNTTPGAIVQMRWKPEFGSPDPDLRRHTAIVLHVLSNGAIFVESNYDDTPGETDDAVVGIRYVSEREFENKVETYSVYYIQ